MEPTDRIGILIANTGTPEAPTPEAVRSYLEAYLMHKRIVPMNRLLWWVILHLFILPKRSETSAAKYKKIWTAKGSPLMVWNERLTEKLNAAFRESGESYTVKLGMSFGGVSIGEALVEFKEEGINRLIVLPLYPQAALSTSKVVEDEVRAAIKEMSWRPHVRYVSDYCTNPVYPKSIAASILNAGFNPESSDKIVFAFHSIPLADIHSGDTYELTTGSSCLAIAGALGIERRQWTIGYMSRFEDRRKWLSPFVPQVLEREVPQPQHRVFVVCPNFSVDCLETLYDVEYKIKPVYIKQLIQNNVPNDDDSFIYVPCLNDSDAHVNLIIDVIRHTVQ